MIGYHCPHANQMKAAIIKQVVEDIRIIDYTH